MIFSSKSQLPDKPAAASGANGGNSPSLQVAAKAAVRTETVHRPPRDARQVRLAQTFAQIVAVLMRDPGYKNLRLADLESLVLPPIMAGQFRLGHATRPTGTNKTDKTSQGGTFVPVAVALWARVSSDVDKGLSGHLDKEVRLRPNEWASGDNLWLMTLAGHPRAVPEFLKQLRANEFKGQHVKMRLRGPDGKVTIKDVGQLA